MEIEAHTGDVRLANPDCDICDGWGFFTGTYQSPTDVRKLTLERCDSCNSFASDSHVVAVAERWLKIFMGNITLEQGF